MDVLPFANRATAAGALGEVLTHYRDQADVTVLGLPRGGIVLAAPIASSLHAPLEPLVVEKVRSRNNTVHSAVAPGGIEVRSWQDRSASYVDHATLEQAKGAAQQELARKTAWYCGEKPPASLHQRCALLVDDGIATGLTMLAAARAVRQLGASKIVLASPVASRAAAQMLASECDEFICLATPTPFNSVAECYLDFARLSDDECVDIVRSFNRRAGSDERQ